MPEMKDGCVKPARGPILPAAQPSAPLGAPSFPTQEAPKMSARIARFFN
jgi:hypothetical protein